MSWRIELLVFFKGAPDLHFRPFGVVSAGYGSEPAQRFISDLAVVSATSYSRKHAITVLNHPPASEGHSIRRPRRYDERVEQALVSLWKVANEIYAG